VALILLMLGAIGAIGWAEYGKQQRKAQAIEFARRAERQKESERRKLADAARADEVLALAEFRAGRYGGAARILRTAAERVAGEPELAALHRGLEARRARARRLAAFYASWERTERFAAVTPDNSTDNRDDETLAVCEAGLREIGALGGEDRWWEHLPANELTTDQRRRLESDVNVALGMMALWRVKRNLFGDGTDGYQAARKLLRRIKQWQTARGHPPSAAAESLDYFCRLSLGETDLADARLPPASAADAYFLGVTHLLLDDAGRVGQAMKFIQNGLGLIESQIGVNFRSPRETAERLLRSAVAQEPGHYWAHFWLGKLLEAKGDFPEAEMEFNTCVALRPDYALGFAARARVLLLAIQRLSQQMARTTPEEGVSKEASAAENDAQAAKEALMLRVLQGLNEGVRRHPYDANVRWSRGQALTWLGQFPQAVMEMNEVGVIEAARLALEGRRAEDGRGASADVLAYLIPEQGVSSFGDIRGSIAILQLALGADDPAGAAATQLLEQDPKHPLALAVRGELALRAGKTAEAVRDFKLALAARPQDPLALAGVARALEKEKDWEGAAKAYAKMLAPSTPADAPGDWWELASHLGSARALAALGREAAARVALENARFINPVAADAAAARLFTPAERP
jgi:tetratricopeptide (TPR) repeat protein